MPYLRLDELKEEFSLKNEGRKPPSNSMLAGAIFAGLKTTARGFGEFDPRRGMQLLGRWNTGRDMAALRAHLLFRIAEYFGVYDLRELIGEEETRPKPTKA
jgi:hypothetical protein